MAEVTVFIEDAAIKLLVAKGRRVQKWAKLPLAPGLVSEGVILDEDQVAGKVKQLFELQGVRARKVTAGLSGFNSIYRVVSLPELPEAIRPEAVRHEATRVIPVSLDQVYLSYQPIPGPAGEMRFFLVAFPRSTADALVRTLRKAGLEPEIMDLAPLALCRTIDEPRAIIIDVRSASLDIAIMVDRVPQLIRSLSLPSEAQSLEERLPTIVEELNRTITFYNSGHLDSILDSSVPIFVSGDLGAATDTWPSLVGTSGYSVSVLPPPIQDLEGFDSTQFMVNIGLALKQLSLEKEAANFSLVNFNALPEVYRRKRTPLSNYLVPVGVLIGIGLIVYMGLFVQNTAAQTGALRAELPPLQSRIVQERETIVEVTEKIEPIEPQSEASKATAGIFETTFTALREGREKIDADLGEITGLVPAEIALIFAGDLVKPDASRLSEAKIIHTGEQVTLRGTALDEADIFRYARALRDGGRFSSVVISSIEAWEEKEIVVEEDEEEEEEEVEVIEEGFNFEFLLVR
jgi:type IV pilus assembly protein PilM